MKQLTGSSNHFGVFWILLVILAVGTLAWGARSAWSAELEFAYPLDGTTFYASEPITVRLVAPTGRQFSTVEVWYSTTWLPVGTDEEAPYEIPISLPFDIGPQKIIAKGEDMAGQWFTTEVTVNLIPRPLQPGVTERVSSQLCWETRKV